MPQVQANCSLYTMCFALVFNLEQHYGIFVYVLMHTSNFHPLCLQQCPMPYQGLEDQGLRAAQTHPIAWVHQSLVYIHWHLDTACPSRTWGRCWRASNTEQLPHLRQWALLMSVSWPPTPPTYLPQRLHGSLWVGGSLVAGTSPTAEGVLETGCCGGYSITSKGIAELRSLLLGAGTGQFPTTGCLLAALPGGFWPVIHPCRGLLDMTVWPGCSQLALSCMAYAKGRFSGPILPSRKRWQYSSGTRARQSIITWWMSLKQTFATAGRLSGTALVSPDSRHSSRSTHFSTGHLCSGPGTPEGYLPPPSGGVSPPGGTTEMPGGRQTETRCSNTLIWRSAWFRSHWSWSWCIVACSWCMMAISASIAVSTSTGCTGCTSVLPHLGFETTVTRRTNTNTLLKSWVSISCNFSKLLCAAFQPTCF